MKLETKRNETHKTTTTPAATDDAEKNNNLKLKLKQKQLLLREMNSQSVGRLAKRGRWEREVEREVGEVVWEVLTILSNARHFFRLLLFWCRVNHKRKWKKKQQRKMRKLFYNSCQRFKMMIVMWKK